MSTLNRGKVGKLDDADTYALFREEHNENHGAGWWVNLRLRHVRVVRLFKDSIYGSSEESFDQAKAYRDAVISVLPPATNHEQAVLLRKNNKSGISGVSHIELADDETWEANLLTRTDNKREKFSVRKYGAEQANAMALRSAGSGWRNCLSNTSPTPNTRKGVVTLTSPVRERPAVTDFSGDAGRNFPCIECFDAMVANCLCGSAAGWN